MKVFWTDKVGSKEFGHLVIYLGQRVDATGATVVKFWSSNHPGGYGQKEVPMTKIHWAIFSRLLNPERIRMLPGPASLDPVLQAMLVRSFSQNEVRRMTAMSGPPARSGQAAGGTPSAIPAR